MRAIIFLAILAAAIAGGYYFYTQQGASSQAPQQSSEMFAPPAAAPAPLRAGECPVTRATYRLRGDPRIRLTFEAPPGFSAAPRAPSLIDSGGAGGAPAILVFSITTTAQSYRFEPVVTPGYERMLLFPFANGRSTSLTGANAIDVSMFDAEYDYIDGVPVLGSTAPAHLFAPDLTRWIYNQGGERRVNSPIGMFDFDNCAPDPAATATTTTATPPPAKQ